MGKKFKRALGIIAAIAIPFAAPAIATAIGLSSAIGAVAGSAVVGGVMGATASNLQGGDWRQGALLGAVGGGVGGYMNAPATPSFDAAINPMPAEALGTLEASISTPSSYVPPGFTGAELIDTSLAMQGVDAGLNNIPLDDLTMDLSGPAPAPSVAPPVTPEAVNPLAGTLPSAPSPSEFLQMEAAGFEAVTPTFGQRFMSALQAVPGEIGKTFTDPRKLADLTLRAAAGIATSSIVGQGLNKEEQQLLAEYQKDMDELRTQNQELFNQRLEQAIALQGDAKYFDPEYFGLQSARRAQTAGARQKRAGLRGMEGPERAILERQYDLGISRNVGSAYDQGYLAGTQGRMQTRVAGLNALPQPTPVNLAGMGDIYKASAQRRATQTQNLNSLFSGLTAPSRSNRDDQIPVGTGR